MPTKAQSELINKHIGSTRFVYNLALECKQMAYAGNRVNISCYDLLKQLPELKKECIWLKEVDSQSLQQSIMNLDKAFTRFFKGKSDFPNFKKKTGTQSFKITRAIRIENNKLKIYKFGKGIDIILHREIKGLIRHATISRAPTGKYFVSIVVDNKKEPPIKKDIQENTTAGIDLGIKTFLVTSDAKEYANPKFLKKSLSRLKFIQSKYSQKKGKQTKYRLQRLHEKVANQRKDFLHKTSAELIKNHDTVCIENLNVKGMLKNHTLAQAISDVAWGEFIRQLKYKAEWYGKNLIEIGRFEPSSKTCSHCGTINETLTLADREWACVSCLTVHDRDLNAAINIKKIGLKNHLSVERRLKNQNELPILVGVLTSETPKGVVH